MGSSSFLSAVAKRGRCGNSNGSVRHGPDHTSQTNMEILYLLYSILSTTITSLILSLVLPFRYLLRRVTGRATLDLRNSVVLYQGTVWHERRRPVHHSFRYSVRYALIDLDNHAPPNHLSAEDARRISGTNGPVLLIRHVVNE